MFKQLKRTIIPCLYFFCLNIFNGLLMVSQTQTWLSGVMWTCTNRWGKALAGTNPGFSCPAPGGSLRRRSDHQRLPQQMQGRQETLEETLVCYQRQSPLHLHGERGTVQSDSKYLPTFPSLLPTGSTSKCERCKWHFSWAPAVWDLVLTVPRSRGVGAASRPPAAPSKPPGNTANPHLRICT